MKQTRRETGLPYPQRTTHFVRQRCNGERMIPERLPAGMIRARHRMNKIGL